MHTFSKIWDIFYSGGHSFRGEQESINEIAFLTDEGYITLSTILIAGKKDYLSLLDTLSIKEHTYNLATGGGQAHMALKILAGQYLARQRQRGFDYEQPFCGYYPDVLSKNKLIAVECGNTLNPEKILIYFQQGNLQECIQIPYPDYKEDKVLGYSFVPRKDLNDFLKKSKRSFERKIGLSVCHRILNFPTSYRITHLIPYTSESAYLPFLGLLYIQAGP